MAGSKLCLNLRNDAHLQSKQLLSETFCLFRHNLIILLYFVNVLSIYYMTPCCAASFRNAIQIKDRDAELLFFNFYCLMYTELNFYFCSCIFIFSILLDSYVNRYFCETMLVHRKSIYYKRSIPYYGGK